VQLKQRTTDKDSNRTPKTASQYWPNAPARMATEGLIIVKSNIVPEGEAGRVVASW
jgi:hypothetical protein